MVNDVVFFNDVGNHSVISILFLGLALIASDGFYKVAYDMIGE